MVDETNPTSPKTSEKEMLGKLEAKGVVITPGEVVQVPAINVEGLSEDDAGYLVSLMDLLTQYLAKNTVVDQFTDHNAQRRPFRNSFLDNPQDKDAFIATYEANKLRTNIITNYVYGVTPVIAEILGQAVSAEVRAKAQALFEASQIIEDGEAYEAMPNEQKVEAAERITKAIKDLFAEVSKRQAE